MQSLNDSLCDLELTLKHLSRNKKKNWKNINPCQTQVMGIFTFQVILLFGTLPFSESFKMITVKHTNMIVVIFDLGWVSLRVFFFFLRPVA